MSIEVVTMIASAATILLALASGFGWMIARTDSRFDRLGRELGDRISGVEHELTEVKVAIARLEGPQQRLLRTR